MFGVDTALRSGYSNWQNSTFSSCFNFRKLSERIRNREDVSIMNPQ